MHDRRRSDEAWRPLPLLPTLGRGRGATNKGEGDLIRIGLVLLVITIAAALSSEPSPQVSAATPVATPAPRATTAARPDPPTCAGAVKGITYYRQAYRRHREAMWLPGPVPRVWYRDCDVVRRRAAEWRDRANVARIELTKWRVHHYAWQDWLPGGWVGIARCETQLNWQHRNSSYEGAFGFAVSTWDGYVGEALARYGDGPYPASAADATPRQQYNVALIVYGHFGLSGWGCRGAYYG